jgi:hypothetical protein
MRKNIFALINASPKNFSVQWIMYNNLAKIASKYIHGSLIDIGCGSKPYFNLLSEYVSKHIGVDHENTLHDKSSINLFGTAYQIPCENESFD